jgi:hypothetical protein
MDLAQAPTQTWHMIIVVDSGSFAILFQLSLDWLAGKFDKLACGKPRSEQKLFDPRDTPGILKVWIVK